MKKKLIHGLSLDQGIVHKIWLTMRLIVLLFFVSLVHVSASVYSQKTKLSIKVENATLQHVFDLIQDQSEFDFFYKNEQIPVDARVSVDAKNETIEAILNNVLKDTGLKFGLVDKDIVIIPIETPEVQQQKKSISGKVTDASGATLPGVSVVVKGTTNGAITDMDGNYSLANIPENAILQFSFVGMKSQETAIGTKTIVNVTMEDETIGIEEVVAIGYGVRKKVTLSGAVGTVDAKILDSKPYPNVNQALQGRIPGLVVNRTGGAPGRSASFQIRGISSLNGGSSLVLIDGAEGDLSRLNSSDIDNISVLKDASASIYGSRASDGVILVTTKSGKKGKPVINVNSYYAVKTPSARRETVTLYQYALMGMDAASDGSVQPGGFGYEYYKPEDLEKIKNNDPNPEPNGIWGTFPKFFQNQNWYDQLISNGSLQNYNVDISGGTDNVSYLVSGALQNENGIVKLGVDNYNQYNFRSKVNVNILKNLVIHSNISYVTSNKKSSVSDYFFGAINQMRCWAPIYTPSGKFYRFQNYPQVASLAAESGYNENSRTSISTNFKLVYEPFKGLKLIGQADINMDQLYSKNISIAYDQYDWYDKVYPKNLSKNQAVDSYNRNKYANYSGLAEFNHTFSKYHNVSALLGFSQEQSTNDNFNGSRKNFLNNQLFTLNLGDASMQYANGGGSDLAIRSFFGRAGYIFDNRYIIDASFRYDGSSRFHPDYRWGFFPSVSTAWVISEENFIKQYNIFDLLKLRASFGIVGNQSGIGLYDYFETIQSPTTAGNYPFGVNGSMTTAARSGGMVSLSRSWESISSTNIGLDMSVLNGRLGLNADLFVKKNNDMLVGVAYPSVLGTSAPYTNNGVLEIKGFELLLSWHDKINKDFTYVITASLDDVTNKVVKLGGIDSYSEGLVGARQGYSTNSYFGYVLDGFIQNNQELADYKKLGSIYQGIRVGDSKYKDIDGDGSITPYGDGITHKGDLVYLGNTNPRYNMGINLDMNWRGFDFSAFFQGVGKRTIMFEGINGIPFNQPWYDPTAYFFNKTWTAENPNSRYPRLTFNKNVLSWNYKVSSMRMINAAYLRLKNLQLGYTLPSNLTNQMKINKLRVYFSGSDLFELQKMPSGYDPEDPSTAVQYPFTRYYSLGLNLTF